MSESEEEDLMQTLYPEFNESLMVCLPKQAVDADEDGQEVYDPEGTRPLNITNADNRIIANAVRLKIEPMLDGIISKTQRGFVGGRSMAANIIDLDEAMARTATTQEEGGAVFFDFAAAFPSVSHKFMIDYLRRSGHIPEHVLRYIERLYVGNRCKIFFGGSYHEGFAQTAGIRQGCPLSPILFALCNDLLLKRIQHVLPESTTTRGYADDLAVVLAKLKRELKVLEQLFEEFERLSGLLLHHGKSVIVPLFKTEIDKLREEIHEQVATWADFSISFTAKYLGIFLGPERKELSWDKPMKKVIDRAKTWGDIGGGQLISIQALHGVRPFFRGSV